MASITPDPTHMNALEAAHHLGITPGLLFSYTKWECEAKPRRLRTIQIDGRTCFDKEEIDDFDRYLCEPWAVEGSPRVRVPTCIVEHLRAESGNQCARCGNGIGVETAHIEGWAASRSHHHHNLIRICSQCHDEHDKHKSLSRDDLRAIKDKLVARTREMLTQHMNPSDRQFMPPFPDTVFVGRLENLETLCKALKVNRTILVQGSGGIGKTQLVLHALSSTMTERRVIWLEVEQYSTVENLVTALAIILTEGTIGVTLDTLVKRLDALQACVVLDGVERFTGPDLDDVDDLLSKLKNSTRKTQFVVTSQVDLQRTIFDKKHVLVGMEAEPSQRLFRSLIEDDIKLDNDSEVALLAFCAGHPLALRLTSALVNHLGSGLEARKLIDVQGVEVIKLQKRTLQNRQTSLALCLSLAYEILNNDEQRLLYLIASCPGGIFGHQLEHFAGIHAPLVVAALRRWSLVQMRDIDIQIERFHVVSPIRSYVRQRWSEEHEPEAQAIMAELLRVFGVMATVIDMQSQEAANIPHMLSRFSEELPNLLLVVEEAEAQSGNADLSLFAHAICTALMRYFFVARLSEQGVRLMMRGAKLAMRDGNWNRASANIVQAATLMQRGHDQRIAVDLESMLDEIDTADSETNGHVAMTRAMLANHLGNACATEQYARNAIEQYELVRSELETQPYEHTEDHQWEENKNNLSGAYQILGYALLDQQKPKEALKAYERARQLMCGASVAVNEGQFLHQIGNCRGELGDHADAADHYAQAAVCFQKVGMEEYLSHALSELGYALIECDDEIAFPKVLSRELLSDGLNDAAKSVIQCFSAASNADDRAREFAMRKLFGIIVVLSLSDAACRLDEVGEELKKWVRMASTRGHDKDRVKQFELLNLDALAELMSAVGGFENRVAATGRVQDKDIDELYKACSYQTAWGNLESVSFKWLTIYLRRKWSIKE